MTAPMTLLNEVSPSGTLSAGSTSTPAALAAAARAASAGKLKLFISYSRDDLDFADQLDTALETYGYACALDRHGISGGEDWQRRLGNLIAEADTVIFILSPSSARSSMCAWEVEEATRLAKRIIPVTCRALEDAAPPPRLAALNYINFYAEPKTPGSGFGKGLSELIVALNTDLDWLRDHTRYLQRAVEWDIGGRPVNRLLSGPDIAAAKAWAGRRPANAPELTALQLDFIRASENAADAQLAQQRAQLAERETLVARAEAAVAAASLEQRRRARMRTFVLTSLSGAAALSIALGVWALRKKAEAQQQTVIAQRETKNAEDRKKEADDVRERALGVLGDATNIIIKSEAGFDEETKKSAYSVFKRGAELGDKYAMYNAGLMLNRGQGVAKDKKASCDWYEAAAMKGHAGAMNNYGYCFEEGLGRPKNKATADEWYKKSAAAGNLMTELALAEQETAARPLGTPPTPEQAKAAAALIAKARAEVGDTDVAMRLAGAYSRGRLMPKDEKEALRLYQLAAAAGRQDGTDMVAYYYEKGRGGLSVDASKARALYQSAANHGFVAGMFNYARCLIEGIGGDKDPERARKILEEAAAKGSATAMTQLGYSYRRGDFGEKNSALGLEWYRKGADAGDTTAMENIGLAYEFGEGVEKSIAMAKEWFERAAAQGSALGMKYRGDLARDNDKDLAEARKWFEKAAAAGNADASEIIDKVSIPEAANAKDYQKALALELARVARIEFNEVDRTGRPGVATAGELVTASWYALMVRDFAKALALAERGHELDPANLPIETNHAHALMLLGRTDEARAIYLAHKGQKVLGPDSNLWEAELATDFKLFADNGLTHPMIAEVQAALAATP